MTSTVIVCSEAHASWLTQESTVCTLSDQKINRLHESQPESSTDMIQGAHTLTCQQLLHSACRLVQQKSKSWECITAKSRANDLVPLPIDIEVAHLDAARGERVVTHLWDSTGQHIHQ